MGKIRCKTCGFRGEDVSYLTGRHEGMGTCVELLKDRVTALEKNLQAYEKELENRERTLHSIVSLVEDATDIPDGRRLRTAGNLARDGLR